LKDKNEIVYADMALCVPSGALAREWAPGTWRLVDYETEYGLKGNLVYADPELGAPPLELPLNATGMYRIYLGINYTKTRYQYQHYSPYGNLAIKLTRDPGFTHVGAEEYVLKPAPSSTDLPTSKLGKGKLIPRSFQEVYWKTAELTGQSLIFRPMAEPYNNEEWRGIANLSYVRLVPATTEDQDFWRQLQPRQDTRRIAFIYCAGNLSGHIDTGPGDYHPTSMDWFRDEITPCLNSDIDIFNLEVIRGSYCTYRTAIGDVGGEGNRWRDEWVDPLAAFTELAHENGLRIFGAMRMIGAAYPATREPLGLSSFYWQHPEWAKRDREGAPTANLSIAFPEVRQYWISLLREVLDYGVDGLTIYLHRFCPFVLYEKPVVETFLERYGEDPRDLPKEDPRWLEHSADYVTRFLHEVRALLDEKPGRELAVAFYGGPSKMDRDPKNWHPIKYNCDVETWIEDEVVHYLFPTQYPRPELIGRWSQLARGRVKIWPDLMPRHQPGEEFAKQAKIYYEAGADGFCLWDAERRAPRISEWAVECRLGHREMLDRFVEEAPSYWRRIPIKYLMGLATRYSFNSYDFVDPLVEDREL
jgi:hypothetical protein